MDRAGAGDDARIRNESVVSGSSVQSGAIHGGVHIHGGTQEQPVVPRQLPGVARHFVDRAIEQDALTTLLNGASSDAVVLVSTIDGTAGVGKSALAVHWAHQMRDRFPDGELYVNLRGFDPAVEPMGATDALASFLAAMGVSAQRIPEDLDSRASLFRSVLHNKRLLVLLDNARSAEHVRPLLPGSPTCVVLITSRNRLDDMVIRDGATRITLDVLSDTEAHDLLGRYLGRDRLDAEPGAVNTLIDHCAGLPLALGIVAVRAAALPDFPLDDLVAELHDECDRLSTLDSGGQTGIRAVFSWSYRLLQPPTARIFRLLGLPAGPDISLAAAAALAGKTQRETRRLLAELTQANLLEHYKPGRFRFHDLLRAYAAECVNQQETREERQAALRRLFDHYLRTSYGIYLQVTPEQRPHPVDLPPSSISGLTFADEDAAFDWWDAEQDNLIATVLQAPRWSLDSYSYKITISLMHWFFHAIRRYIDNLKVIFEVALESARKLGDRHSQGVILAMLGKRHYDADVTEAVSYYTESAVLFEGVGDQYRRANSLISLGPLLVWLARHEEAKRQVLDGLELFADDDYEGKGAAYHVLGLLYTDLRQFDEAFEYFEKSLLCLRRIARNELVSGFTLQFLADAYRAAGRMDDALATYREAIAIRRQIGHLQGEAESLQSLGEALRQSGNLEEARAAGQEALAIYERLGDPAAAELRSRFDTR